MSSPLDLEVSELAKAHILAAEEWWRLNRPKAPNAIREELERAAAIITIHPEARNGNDSRKGGPFRGTWVTHHSGDIDNTFGPNGLSIPR